MAPACIAGDRSRAYFRNMTYRVRRAEMSDAVEIAGVHVRSWRETYQGLLPARFLDGMTMGREFAFWRALLHRHLVELDEAAFVAEAGAEAVGFGACGQARDRAATWDGEISMVYVLRAHQHSGLGRALMGLMADFLITRGFFSAGLWVVDGNSRARAFYEHLGGKMAGRRTERMRGADVATTAYVFEDLSRLSGRLLARL